MKKFILCLLCVYSFAQGREVEFTRAGTITLPDKGPVTLNDLPEQFRASFTEIKEKIPELSLPPRGKGIDVSGIYYCEVDNSYFSVHQREDRVVLVNINKNLRFLKDIYLISEEELQNGISPSIEEFVFLIDRNLIDSIFHFSDWKPNFQTMGFRKHSNTDALFYTIGVGIVLPMVMENRASPSRSNIDQYQMSLYFSYFDGQPMQMEIAVVSGVISATPRKACPRIF